MEKTNGNKNLIETMFKAGAHFAFSRSRRHPTAKPFVFGAKNKVEIFDLEKTSPKLEAAKAFVAQVALSGKQLLFVGGKSEARDIIAKAAASIDMPFSSGRWIGGTFTNFGEVRKRVEKMESLISKREKGELAKYTKKERLLIDREIDKLHRMFHGLVLMKEMPKALFVVDPRHEDIAVEEARAVGIPVIALAGSDCDLTLVDYPIPGNDSSVTSITFFVNEILHAFKEGKKTVSATQAATPAAK
jgi:small subunit ribosomal protein S2